MASDITARPASATARYLLLLLVFSYFLSLFDRQILVLMVEPIKADLGVTDLQFSLLHGLAFTSFYSTLGIAFGIWVDKMSRTNLLAIAILLWSVATVICGLVTSFEGLFVARMLVGVGEAALSPVAYSLIVDLFPKHRQARAFGTFHVGLYLGAGLAFVLGSQILAVTTAMPELALPGGFEVPGGWRTTFLIAGAPGILMGILLLLAREPERGGGKGSSEISLGAYLRHVAGNARAFLIHHGAMSCTIGFGFAKTLWFPAHYNRVHGWSLVEIGASFGVILLVIAPIASMLGGRVIETLRRNGYSDAYMRTGAIICIVDIFATALAVLSSDPWLGLVGVAIAMCCPALNGGPASASLQLIVPPGGSGKSGAGYTLVTQLFGVSLIPMIAALVSGHFLSGPADIGYGLLIVGILVLIPAASVMWFGRGYFLDPAETATSPSAG